MTTIDILKSKITLTLGVATLIGMLFAFGDSRWAPANDVKELSIMIYDESIGRLEFNISESERRIKRIMLITEEDRTNWEKGEVLDQKASKEMFLRLLNRLKEK